MSTPFVLSRLFFFYVLSSLTLSAAAWAFIGPPAFIYVPILLLIASLLFWTTLEARMISFCRATERPSPGLSHSYRRALEDAALMASPPALRVIPSPTLQLLVARSLGGSGLVLMSQGMLGILDETELRAVLAKAARRVVRSDTPARSLASWIALKLLGWAPSQWLSVSYEVAPDRAAPGSLTPGTLFLFIVIVPLIRFFLAMSLLHPVERLVRSAGGPMTEPLNDAIHKIERAIETWRLTATPIRYPFL